MKKETINETEIIFYNSIKEVPEWKWQLMQSFILQEEYIGSTLEAVTKHHAKFDGFLKAKMYDELLEERINLTFTFNAAINNLSAKSKAIVCLVYSINGEKVDISSDDKLEAVRKLLLETDISNGKVDDLLGELKKKLLMN